MIVALGDDSVKTATAVGPDAVAPSVGAVEIGPTSAGEPVSSPRRWRLGGPRVSTLVLLSIWVAALVIYLQVRPGG